MEAHVNEALDSAYVIYPRHLLWLMQHNNLTVPEICVALGLSSIQDWFAMQRDESEPVRKTSIAQTARIYLNNPQLLRSPDFKLDAFIMRVKHAFNGDEETAILAMEAVFHKKWKTIEGWQEDDTKATDLAVRRYVELMMKLDEGSFKSMLLNGIVNTHVQIKARSVTVQQSAALENSMFQTSENTQFDIKSMMEIVPTPGRRINKKDYQAPESDVDMSSAVAASMNKSRENGDNVLPMSDEMLAAQAKAKKIWGGLTKSKGAATKEEESQ